MAEEPLFVGQTNIQRRCETTEGTRHPERERTRWEVGPQREAESSAGRYSASPAALTAETSACKLLWLTDLWTKKCFIHYRKVSCLWKEGSYIVAYYTYYRSGWYVNIVLFTWRQICWNLSEEWNINSRTALLTVAIIAVSFVVFHPVTLVFFCCLWILLLPLCLFSRELVK